MLSGNRHWLEYDSVALVVLFVCIGFVALIVLGIWTREVAQATYRAAVARWPKARITLRQGIRVVGRTRRVAEADSDLHRGSNRSELRPSLLSRLQPLWRGPKSKPYRSPRRAWWWRWTGWRPPGRVIPAHLPAIHCAWKQRARGRD